MLRIVVSAEEEWDDEKEEFLPAIKPIELHLEHSLVSLSKWESKWKKPFLSTYIDKEMMKDYIKCMCINSVPDEVFDRISEQDKLKIIEYIDDPMTATWFSEDRNPTAGPRRNARLNGEIVTAEVVYYWMITAQIPFECQKWHFNRLITLIRVIDKKNNPPKKMSQKDIINQYSRLNAQRRAKYKTKG